MLDILAIKADVYQLERQGKRLPVYRHLREVWQKEPPSEGLTVLALQQMVDYVEYVDDLTVLVNRGKQKTSMTYIRIFCWT